MELEMMERKRDLQMRYSEFLIESANYEYDLEVDNILVESDQSGTRKSIGDRIKELIKKLTEALKNLFHKLFPEKSPEKVIDDAKKIIKDNPSLSSEKVEVEMPDFKKVSEKIKYCKSLIKKYREKIARGETLSESELSALENSRREVKNHKGKIKRNIAIGSLITVSAAGLAAIGAGSLSAKMDEKDSRIFSSWDIQRQKYDDYLNKSDKDSKYDPYNDIYRVISIDCDIEREKLLLLKDNANILDRLIINRGFKKRRNGELKDYKGNRDYLDHLNELKSGSNSHKVFSTGKYHDWDRYPNEG